MQVTLKTYLAFTSGLNDGVFDCLNSIDNGNQDAILNRARIMSIKNGNYLVRDDKAFIVAFCIAHNNIDIFKDAWRKGKDLLRIAVENKLIELKDCDYFYSRNTNRFYLEEL